MNHQNNHHDSWPKELQKAVRDFPRIEASPDLDQRIYAALAERQAKQNKINAFCDALDRLFERPLVKFLGTALFAILLAWGGSSILLQCSGVADIDNRSQQHRNADTLPIDFFSPQLSHLYARQLGAQHQLPYTDAKASKPKVLLPKRKETSCSPNATILWG